MKRFVTHLFLLFFIVFDADAQNVAINNTAATADPSAILDVNSSTKGMLIPRMTEAQRIAIASPATGLLVFQTNNTAGFYYNAGTPGSPTWLALQSILSGWSTTGNSGIDTAMNFLGTKDAADLKFRVNNLRAGRIGTDGSVFLGVGSGNKSTGSYNVGVGRLSLSNNTSGFRNTAVGAGSLSNNTGWQNTAIGFNSLLLNVSGNGNTALGDLSLQGNTNGHGNTAIGQASLLNNSQGYSNVAIGIDALRGNQLGHNLVAIGDSALMNNTSDGMFDGLFNTAVGSKALLTNTSGGTNTAVGFGSMRFNTIGGMNTALGASTLQNNIDGGNNIAVGYKALWNAATNNNIAIGNSALAQSLAISNIAIGSQSLQNTSIGSQNTAVGHYVLSSNTIGERNLSLGEQSMYSNVGGSYNTALGSFSLSDNVNGNFNTVLGYNADVQGSSQFNSTALGANASANCSDCLVLGSINGINYATSDTKVGIGINNPWGKLHVKGNSQLGANMQLLLEENENDFVRFTMANTSTSNFWDIAGLPQATTANARLNFYYNGLGDVLSLRGNGNAVLAGTLTQSSDARLKKNIAPIESALTSLMKINGYRYQWQNQYRSQEKQIGVLAQEVQKVFPELVDTDEQGMLSVNYSGLVPVMISAIKQQQQQIQNLESVIEKLEQRLNKLEKQ